MKVLVSAFTCGPSRGSEPGAGWAWTLAASRGNDVWVLTRCIPADRLEHVIAEQAPNSLKVVYVETAPWIRKWFPGGIGLRLSYLAWQRKVRKAARRLDAEIGFDLVHHVTFANVWLPAGVADVGAPFVLGPVGGGPRIILRMWPELGVRGAAGELLRLAAQEVSRLNPSVRRGWRKARIILVQNRETLEALPRRYRHKCRIRHHATMDPIDVISPIRDEVSAKRSGKLAIYAGRLVAWKGPTMAIRAIAELDDWNLLIVGSGPEHPRLVRLVRDLRLEGRVDFIPWLPRQELHRTLSHADVVVVPSLRDDSPFIVAEAHALGRPVAAFDQGGLATFAALNGTSVTLAPLTGGRRSAARGLADAIVAAGRETTEPLSEAFSSSSISDDLRSVYAEATGLAC